MANAEHLNLLQQETAIWNDWRIRNPALVPNLSGADLSRANLSGCVLISTDLRDATLTGSTVFGVSVWSIEVNEGTQQQNLVITGPGEPEITVDNLKVAQFIYLLLTNKENSRCH